jgi:hypothetical protein
MAVILALLLTGLIGVFIAYLSAFLIELDGDKELLIKDGLIKEVLTKAVSDISTLYVINTKDKSITVDRTIIEEYDTFWFPYKVDIQAKSYHERQTDEDFGGTVGYVTRFSKDYYIIKSLLKKEKVDIVKVQKQKLGL